VRLDENLGAVAAELTPAELADIDRLASQLPIEGARYPDDLERRTGL
jgi:hypothetical protein